ncbi:MAG TPA: hypothetical protein VFI62_12265 [Burkholderiales bacterium]|nr:hypothetical protein [Burkholderiales bacterium]
MRQRRCTATLTLVLISSAALHGCGGEQEPGAATRDIYRSRADCQRDWDDASKCEPVASGPHAGMFYGPLLYGLSSGMGGRGPIGSQMAPRPGTNAVASTSVPRGETTRRGGFGSSASSYSSGG